MLHSLSPMTIHVSLTHIAKKKKHLFFVWIWFYGPRWPQNSFSKQRKTALPLLISLREFIFASRKQGTSAGHHRNASITGNRSHHQSICVWHNMELDAFSPWIKDIAFLPGTSQQPSANAWIYEFMAAMDSKSPFKQRRCHICAALARTKCCICGVCTIRLAFLSSFLQPIQLLALFANVPNA